MSIILTVSCTSTATADWQVVQSGDIVPADGVYGDADTARLTLEALTATRQERDLWRDTAFTLQDTVNSYTHTIEDLNDLMAASIQTERKAASAEIRKHKKGKVRALLAGVCTGVLVALIASH